MDKKALLDWHLAAGVDECVDNTPQDRFIQSNASLQEGNADKAPQNSQKQAELDRVAPLAMTNSSSPAIHHSPSDGSNIARALADGCQTIEELEKAVRAFDGCVLKKTASKTVFADGNPKARIMIIGEAPGAQEDKQGIPFCGPSGALLDNMLAAIGLDRTKVYISNTVFWRPPGNRQPSAEETAICLPLVEKHIALVNPALLILSGGTASTTLLNKDTSISRLRGKFYDYENVYMQKPTSAAVTYHPSYLLRSPGQKRLAWNDMLSFKRFLKENDISI